MRILDLKEVTKMLEIYSLMRVKISVMIFKFIKKISKQGRI